MMISAERLALSGALFAARTRWRWRLFWFRRLWWKR
jgi:hypothetical protein